MSNPKEEIAELLEADKERLAGVLSKAVEEARVKIFADSETLFSNIYHEYLPWVATDLYSNVFLKYNQWLLDNYGEHNEIIGGSTAKELRKRIYNEHRDEIIKDLDKDNLELIQRLKSQNSMLQEQLSSRY